MAAFVRTSSSRIDPDWPHIRDHLLEALESALDIGASGDIVLDIVDKRGVWDASRVGGGVLAAGGGNDVRDLLGALAGESAALSPSYQRTSQRWKPLSRPENTPLPLRQQCAAA